MIGEPGLWLLLGGLLLLTVHKGTSGVDLAGIPSKQAIVIAALIGRFNEQRVLRPYEIAAMLAIGEKESHFEPAARSPDAAPDATGGHSWGVFQFNRRTLDTLGVPLDTLVPVRNADGSIPEVDLIRAARGSADAALAMLTFRPGWAGGRSYLVAIRALHPSDQRAQIREMFVAWAGGVGKRYSDIADVPRNDRPGSLGYIHVTIESKFSVLPKYLRVMGLGGLGRWTNES